MKTVLKKSCTAIKYSLQFYLKDCISYIEKKGEGKLKEKFLVVGNRYFAYNAFFMSFYMQGLALIDLAKLRFENVDSTRMTDNENRYLIVNTYRSKTRKQVQVAIRMDNFTSFIFPTYLDYMVNHDYLVPILTNDDDTSKKITIKMRSATTAINHNLKNHSVLKCLVIIPHKIKIFKALVMLLFYGITSIFDNS